MNIKDIDQLDPKNTLLDNLPVDMLEAIYEAQRRLMQKYKGLEENHFEKIFGVKGTIPDKVWAGDKSNVHTKAGNHFIVENINATIHELSEATQVLKNWKSWKQTEVEADADHYREEMIDALHFFMEAFVLSGITPKEIYETYLKKNKVNQARQRTNY
jgi:dimeric dUTPase (all-alpha-NTP-PPase superfamily)